MTRTLNLNQVKNQLQETRRQLASSIGLRDEAYVEQAADTLDQIQAFQARELALRNLDRTVQKLRQVEAALCRIDADEYGVCSDCEDEIGAKRLQAVPWAQRCIRCQEEFDQYRPEGDANGLPQMPAA